MPAKNTEFDFIESKSFIRWQLSLSIPLSAFTVSSDEFHKYSYCSRIRFLWSASNRTKVNFPNTHIQTILIPILYSILHRMMRFNFRLRWTDPLQNLPAIWRKKKKQRFIECTNIPSRVKQFCIEFEYHFKLAPLIHQYMRRNRKCCYFQYLLKKKRNTKPSELIEMLLNHDLAPQLNEKLKTHIHSDFDMVTYWTMRRKAHAFAIRHAVHCTERKKNMERCIMPIQTQADALNIHCIYPFLCILHRSNLWVSNTISKSH